MGPDQADPITGPIASHHRCICWPSAVGGRATMLRSKACEGRPEFSLDVAAVAGPVRVLVEAPDSAKGKRPVSGPSGGFGVKRVGLAALAAAAAVRLVDLDHGHPVVGQEAQQASAE